MMEQWTRQWLNDEELAAWVRLAAVLELLPGVLDSQLRHDAELTHFDYYALAMLSEAPQRTLRMTSLAAQTNATLPRLSHVIRRLEDRGLVERFPCPQDARATNVRLTPAGWNKVLAHRTGPRRQRPAARHRRADPRTGPPADRHRRRHLAQARPGRHDGRDLPPLRPRPTRRAVAAARAFLGPRLPVIVMA